MQELPCRYLYAASLFVGGHWNERTGRPGGRRAQIYSDRGGGGNARHVYGLRSPQSPCRHVGTTFVVIFADSDGIPGGHA